MQHCHGETQNEKNDDKSNAWAPTLGCPRKPRISPLVKTSGRPLGNTGPSCSASRDATLRVEQLVLVPEELGLVHVELVRVEELRVAVDLPGNACHVVDLVQLRRMHFRRCHPSDFTHMMMIASGRPLGNTGPWCSASRGGTLQVEQQVLAHEELDLVCVELVKVEELRGNACHV